MSDDLTGLSDSDIGLEAVPPPPADQSSGTPPTGAPQSAPSVDPSIATDLEYRKNFPGLVVDGSSKTSKSPPAPSQSMKGLSDADIGLGDAASAPENISPSRAEGRKAGQDVGAMGASTEGMGEGLIGNLGDYPIAAIAGGVSAITGNGFEKGYQDSLERSQGFREGIQQNHPYASIAGNVASAGMGVSKLASGVNAATKGIPWLSTTAGNVAKSVGVGTGAGGWGGFSSGDTIADRGSQALSGGAWGAGLGMAGEALGAVAMPAIKKFAGSFTAAPAGVDPAARIAAADEFNIPLSRGQATGNLPQQAWEQAAVNQAKDSSPNAIMSGFQNRQQAAIDAAKSDIQASLPNGLPSNFTDPTTTGEDIAQRVKGIAADTRAQSDAAYASAAAKPGWIDASDIQTLHQGVTGDLQTAGYDVNTPGALPASKAAMNVLDQLSQLKGAPPGATAMSLQGVEQARKALVQLTPGNGTDAGALKVIRNGFNNWLDNAVNGRLFSGDPTALDDLKNARGLWSQWKSLTAGKQDYAAKMVSKIASENITGDQVLNWATGTAGIDQAGRAMQVLSKLKGLLGVNSPEWQGLRQAKWNNILQQAKGEGGPKGTAAAIDDLVDGKGKPVAISLYSPAEIDKMRRFSAVLKTLPPSPKVTNSAKSGYEIGRVVANVAGHLGLATVGAGLAEMTGKPEFWALGALPLIRNAAARQKAVQALKALGKADTGVLSKSLPTGAAANIGRSALGTAASLPQTRRHEPPLLPRQSSPQ